MGLGLFRRTWRADRLVLAVCGLGSLIAAIAWRVATRPMGDTPSYQATAVILGDGWGSLTDRGPGYPLVLLLTGSTEAPTRLLFLVQLALHVAAIVLVVDLARRADVGRNGRVALAVLLFAPAVLLRVVYAGSEALAAFVLTAVLWLLLSPPARGHRTGWALGLGALCGAAGLVRPNFAVLFIPVALLAAVPRRAGRWRTAALIAAPAVLLVGGYSVANGVRFDSFGLTPLTSSHLSSKTAPYVEELPASYEPARSVLIEERDAALLRGRSSAPDNYIWVARPKLEEATGLEGRALDRYLMEIDVYLIVHHPFDYLDSVRDASTNYTSMDSQPAVLGLGRPAAWLQQALHLALSVVFVAALACIPGLALARRIPRGQLWPLTAGVVLAASTWITAVATETGTARLRAPSEPILALILVLAVAIVWPQLPRRQPDDLSADSGAEIPAETAGD